MLSSASTRYARGAGGGGDLGDRRDDEERPRLTGDQVMTLALREIDPAYNPRDAATSVSPWLPVGLNSLAAPQPQTHCAPPQPQPPRCGPPPQPQPPQPQQHHPAIVNGNEPPTLLVRSVFARSAVADRSSYGGWADRSSSSGGWASFPSALPPPVASVREMMIAQSRYQPRAHPTAAAAGGMEKMLVVVKGPFASAPAPAAAAAYLRDINPAATNGLEREQQERGRLQQQLLAEEQRRRQRPPPPPPPPPQHSPMQPRPKPPPPPPNRRPPVDVGDRVVKGPDWDVDYSPVVGEGTVVSVDVAGWVVVKWDRKSNKERFRMGSSGKFEVERVSGPRTGLKLSAAEIAAASPIAHHGLGQQHPFNKASGPAFPSPFDYAN